MSVLVAHLAAITARRDPEGLDVGLVQALVRMLQPVEVALHRCVGDAADPRWLTCARMGPGDPAPQTPSAWVDFKVMPRLDAFAEREDCVVGNRIVRHRGPPAQVCLPVSNGGRVTGVLELRTVQPLDSEVLDGVAGMLRVCGHFRDLLDYSERDSLTGLLNRKSFDESFLRLAIPRAPAPTGANELRRGEAGCGGWLAVLDIDHFKRVNDRFGHPIGDEVLLLLAQLMQANFRANDHLYRFGGEEFVVLMRCASRSDAQGALERLRASIERHAFPQAGRITASIGFTELRSEDSPSSAFARADQAVYFAKQNGRNRVCDHDALVSSGDLAEADRASHVELF